MAPSGRSCPTDSYLGLTVKWGLDTTDDHHRVGTGTPSPLPLRAYLAERGLNWGAGLVPIGPIDAIPEGEDLMLARGSLQIAHVCLQYDLCSAVAHSMADPLWQSTSLASITLITIIILIYHLLISIRVFS